MNGSKYDDAGKLVLRVTLGGLLLFHGVAKILDAGSVQFIAGKLGGLGLPEALAYGVYLGEVAAPLMIILGLFSRVGGALVVVNMGFAIWLVHTDELFRLSETGGWHLELQGFYLLCGLAVVFLGSGRAALLPDRSFPAPPIHDARR